MSVLIADSFDHYATADITEKHTEDGSGTIGSGNGRCGTNAYTNATSGGSLRTGVTNSDETGVIGTAFRPGVLNGTNYYEIGDGDGDILALLVAATDGSVQLWTGPNTVAGTQVATSAAGLLSVGIYAFIEFKWRIHDTLGTLEAFINGLSVASATGLDTIPPASGAYTPNPPWRTTFITTGGGTDNAVDDMYVLNGAGSAPVNDALGDVHVTANFAELDSVGGAGTYTGWTPSSGSDHGAMVDETPPDGDTTYLSTSSVNARDTVTFPDISLVSGTVYSAQVIVNAKKDNASLGNRNIQVVTVSGATTNDGTVQAISDGYKFYREVHDVDPNTSAAWTVANVNLIEGGVKLES